MQEKSLQGFFLSYRLSPKATAGAYHSGRRIVASLQAAAASNAAGQTPKRRSGESVGRRPFPSPLPRVSTSLLSTRLPLRDVPGNHTACYLKAKGSACPLLRSFPKSVSPGATTPAAPEKSQNEPIFASQRQQKTALSFGFETNPSLAAAARLKENQEAYKMFFVCYLQREAPTSLAPRI